MPCWFQAPAGGPVHRYRKGRLMTTRKRSSGDSTADEEKLLASLRQFIRTKGADYLEDPNISSIGVGHKITDGKPTGEIALQFTVDKKMAEPEALESLHTEPIPQTIVVDGVAVPTDVIERSYRPTFRIVAEARSPHSKLRVDPIVPGVTVGHVRVSAGTIGCIVYDKNDGTPRPHRRGKLRKETAGDRISSGSRYWSAFSMGNVGATT